MVSEVVNTCLLQVRHCLYMMLSVKAFIYCIEFPHLSRLSHHFHNNMLPVHSDFFPGEQLFHFPRPLDRCTLDLRGQQNEIYCFFSLFPHCLVPSIHLRVAGIQHLSAAQMAQREAAIATNPCCRPSKQLQPGSSEVITPGLMKTRPREGKTLAWVT